MYNLLLFSVQIASLIMITNTNYILIIVKQCLLEKFININIHNFRHSKTKSFTVYEFAYICSTQYTTRISAFVLFLVHCITKSSPFCLGQQQSKHSTNTYRKPKNSITKKLISSTSSHQ